MINSLFTYTFWKYIEIVLPSLVLLWVILSVLAEGISGWIEGRIEKRKQFVDRVHYKEQEMEKLRRKRYVNGSTDT